MSLLDDLVTFARIEQEAHDIEPWAEVIGALDLDVEERLWLISLYNTFDDLGSAVKAFEWWPEGPLQWAADPDGERAGTLWCTQERRGLRGGRVTQRLASYAALVGAHGSQERWLGQAALGMLHGFENMTKHLRSVWGVGRQSAFEWAEFLAKSAGWPLVCTDAQLWESSGPRRSIEAFYADRLRRSGRTEAPGQWWLDSTAHTLRDHLAACGVPLSWEDFETVLCDFRVMTKGRYYPGKHLSSLRGEIATLFEHHEPWYDRLMLAFLQVVPEPWCHIAPYVSPTGGTEYVRTGRIIDRP